MSFGPLILGHRDPEVAESLQGAIARGWTYGACEAYSLELAEHIIHRIPFLDKIRFVNSGTEAVMTAIRLARGYTGKDKIIKFAGCYHGHTDSMLIKAGSSVAMIAESSSKGVPAGVAQDTIVLELDDLPAVEAAFAAFPNQIAGIILEPLPANNGLLIQREEYLRGLAAIAKKNGALLILDEVISGFRIGFGGMAEKLNLTPDLVTYGKIIGGGLPVGAVAGKGEIMDCLAPHGGVFQAGTLSANPLAMVAGLATLRQLDAQFYADLETTSNQVGNILSSWLQSFSEAQLDRYGSLFWINPGKEQVRQVSAIPANLQASFQPIFSKALAAGVYLAPSGYEVGFVSRAHQAVLPELEAALNPVRH